MDILALLSGNTVWIGVVLVGGFCIWKFVAQPMMNEGMPIEPDPNHKTFTEQMEDGMSTECSI